jgi:hypothetical protein
MNDTSTAMNDFRPQKRKLQRTALMASTLALACLGFGYAAAAIAAKPDALLQIDLNRGAVVEKIVASWGREIPAAQIESFKSKLMGLRADHLLAANLSGSFDGVLEVLQSKEASPRFLVNAASSAPHATDGLTRADLAKALGDSTQDLVYTPITPCNLMDTRSGVVPAPPIGAPSLAAGYAIRNIQVSGNCGIPSNAQAVSAQFTVENIPSAGGVVFAGKTGGSASSAVVSWSVPANYASGASAIPLSAGGQMQLQSAGATQIKVDVNGYFRAPGGVIGDITSVVAGAGLTGGSTSGGATLSLATTQLLPTTACAANQIAKWNGSAWACAADATGAVATNAWTQGGNAFGVPGVIGTTDAQDLTVRSGGSLRLVTGVVPTKTFSFEAGTGDVIAPNIVTAQGKFAAPTNFPGGANTKQIGDRFRDNSIIAWARVDATGSPFSTGSFGIVSVTKTAIGAYTVILDVSAASGNGLAAVVTPEIDNQPTGAASMRIASVNMSFSFPNTVQIWMNNGSGTPVDNEFVLLVTAR